LSGKTGYFGRIYLMYEGKIIVKIVVIDN